jgi:hypothetical protein
VTGLRLTGLVALALLTSCASYDPFALVYPDDGLAERGIGGTGIVGVITAFGSVWVDGVEVEVPVDTPIDADGRQMGLEDLRLGQIAVIAAVDAGGGLTASSLSIRHEVSGPVEAVEDGGALMIVAGQRVVLSETAVGDVAARRGDWVAVSGIRQPGGDIVATRIDKRPPGLVTVHGSLASSGSSLRIGRLGLEGDVPADVTAVSVSGRYDGGVLTAEAVVPDLLVTDPGAHFGDDVDRLLIETYVRAVDGLLQVNGGLLTVSAGPAVGGIGGGSAPIRAVVEFVRDTDGAYQATGVRVADGRPASPHASPAPLPAIDGRPMENLPPPRGQSL